MRWLSLAWLLWFTPVGVIAVGAVAVWREDRQKRQRRKNQ